MNYEIERRITWYVNNSRNKRGLKRLRYNVGLIGLARDHSKTMSRKGRIFHGDAVHCANNALVNRTLLESIKSYFLNIGISGENVALMPKGLVRGHKKPLNNAKDIALALHKCWMNSPGHKSNILNSEFKHIGVGIYRKGNKFYATQVFFG